jgi:AcrR family transcriptional regulator
MTISPTRSPRSRTASKKSPDELPSVTDVEAEFERFAASLMPVARRDVDARGSKGGRPGPPPSISAETIYEHALKRLDKDGVEALTVRRLAADLRISTRTLYKRIKNHDNMIRKVVELHFSKLRLDLRPCGQWESTAMNWCMQLHKALTDHPHLTQLLADDETPTVADYMNELLEATLREGISQDTATTCIRSLADVTINDAIRRVRLMHAARDTQSGAARSSEPATTFPETVEWILAGVRASATEARALDA